MSFDFASMWETVQATLVGAVPGLLLALLMFTLREPKRQAVVEDPNRVGSKNNNLVESVVEIFNSKEQFAIALTPDGC